jgi:hypothetical protein
MSLAAGPKYVPEQSQREGVLCSGGARCRLEGARDVSQSFLHGRRGMGNLGDCRDDPIEMD